MDYQTTNLQEATFLYVEGFRLLRTELKSTKMVFSFDEGAEEGAARYERSSGDKYVHDLLPAYGVLRSLALDSKKAAHA